MLLASDKKTEGLSVLKYMDAHGKKGKLQRPSSYDMEDDINRGKAYTDLIDSQKKHRLDK